MRLLKGYLSILDLVSPNLAARQMYSFMSNPRFKKLRAFENTVLDQAAKGNITFKDFNICTYVWGEKSDKVALMIHGWEGQAGNFGGLIPALLEKGYQVIAFDAPSHGYSSKGKTNMFHFVEIIETFIAQRTPDLIISHSFGSVTAAAAIRSKPDLTIEHWIMVTSPHDFRERIEDVAKTLEVSDKTTNKLIGLIEKDTNEHIDNLNMTKYCGEIKNVNDVLIVHSIHDKILPISTSRKVHAAFEKSEMIELENLGHYKILWSDELKEIIKKKFTSRND